MVVVEVVRFVSASVMRRFPRAWPPRVASRSGARRREALAYESPSRDQLFLQSSHSLEDLPGVACLSPNLAFSLGSRGSRPSSQSLKTSHHTFQLRKLHMQALLCPPKMQC